MTPSERASHLRQEPLRDQNERVVMGVTTIDQPAQLKVYAVPRFMVFIERMWHGDFQQIPVDPDEIPALIRHLEQARDIAHADDVMEVDGV